MHYLLRNALACFQALRSCTRCSRATRSRIQRGCANRSRSLLQGTTRQLRQEMSRDIALHGSTYGIHPKMAKMFFQVGSESTALRLRALLKHSDARTSACAPRFLRVCAKCALSQACAAARARSCRRGDRHDCCDAAARIGADGEAHQAARNARSMNAWPSAGSTIPRKRCCRTFLPDTITYAGICIASGVVSRAS
eukprot:1571456-Pleurochrysis_carterae.AAC.2